MFRQLSIICIVFAVSLVSHAGDCVIKEIVGLKHWWTLADYFRENVPATPKFQVNNYNECYAAVAQKFAAYTSQFQNEFKSGDLAIRVSGDYSDGSATSVLVEIEHASYIKKEGPACLVKYETEAISSYTGETDIISLPTSVDSDNSFEACLAYGVRVIQKTAEKVKMRGSHVNYLEHRQIDGVSLPVLHHMTKYPSSAKK